MCGHQARGYRPPNMGRNFWMYPVWGQKMLVWAPKWPKFKFSVVDLYHQEKHPEAFEALETRQKGLWGEYLNPIGTLQDAGLKSKKFSIFTAEPASKNLRCAIWVRIPLPSPFCENFGFFEKNRTFFIPLSSLSDWNSTSCAQAKIAQICPQSPI